VYRLVRPLLFQLSPERAQRVALSALRVQSWLGAPEPDPPSSAVELLGLRFPNRIGLAAGFDKSARYVDDLAQLGFGFIEVGTVTPRPQAGNPLPTIFRLIEDEALINRMGFPSEGAQAAAHNLERRFYGGVCGVNIGKNRDTPLAEAARDYVACLRMVYGVADYVAINISSPNTPGLRDLQHVEQLRELLLEVAGAREQLQPVHGKRVPLLVKIAPDMEDRQLEAIAAELRQLPVDGVIATNTTTQRPASLRSPAAAEQGGLSGRPLQPLSLHVVRALRGWLGSRFPIIGVGGVMSAEDGQKLLGAGADLVQVFTGLIYSGPVLVRRLLQLEVNRVDSGSQPGSPSTARR
jgi:dihydroorotate dehydrogenase